MSIEGVVDQLAAPKIWMSRSDILERSSPVPRTPGVYAWYLSANAAWADAVSRIVHSGCALMYVGIAPARRHSMSNFRKRLRLHSRENQKSSTFRKTLATLSWPSASEEQLPIYSTHKSMLTS